MVASLRFRVPAFMAWGDPSAARWARGSGGLGACPWTPVLRSTRSRGKLPWRRAAVIFLRIMRRFGCGLAAKPGIRAWPRARQLTLNMEHSMRAVMRTIALVLLFVGLASGPLAAQANPPPPAFPRAPAAPRAIRNPQSEHYSSNEVIDAGHRFFGTVSRGLAQIVEKAGSQWGLPNGYVLGQEAGGAVVAGLRYGEGSSTPRMPATFGCIWQGPSLGFDFGGEGARTMMLVYNLPATDAIYQRFAGIDGSAYFVGGLGMTASDVQQYRRRADPHPASDCALAPMSAI